MHSSDLDSTLRDFDASSMSNPGLGAGEGNGNCSFYPQSFDDFGMFNQIMDPALDSLSFSPINTVAAGARSSSLSNNLDIWNDFTFDVNALGEEFFSEPYHI